MSEEFIIWMTGVIGTLTLLFYITKREYDKKKR